MPDEHSAKPSDPARREPPPTTARRMPGVYRRGRAWWISYYDRQGRRHREPAGRSYRQAMTVRALRVADVETGRLGLRRRRVPTFRQFVENTWRPESAIHLKPATRRSYESILTHHLLPTVGDLPLPAITRAMAKGFIARKTQQQRAAYSRTRPNPHRPRLSPKTIKNAVALLAAILEVATADYDLLPNNPLRGILRRRHFPQDAPRERRPRILEPGEFVRAIEQLRPPIREAVLVAALTGVRWSEQIAIRAEEDIDFAHNHLRITRSLYRRVPQTPKTQQSVRDIDMSPLVRRIFQRARREGYVFSKDGTTPLGSGNWLKRQWRAAQLRAGVRHPIRWHDLRHQFVSLLIAIGKNPKYIASQAGHASAGFTLDRYGHLFETVTPVAVEWPEDLLWPGGCDQIVPKPCADGQEKAGEQVVDASQKLQVKPTVQE